MPDMANHRDSTAPIRRARFAAWTVFLSMAGTTIAFQVYHAVKFGQMPKSLAVIFGVVLLLMSVCILEFIAEWRGAPGWVKVAAYAVIGGAMFMSAGATGQVVLHAAPPHMSLLFGILMDSAALLAVHFIFNGPTAAATAAAVAGREAALRAELHAVSGAREADVSALRAQLESERNARETAQSELAQAVAKAEALTRKLDAATGPESVTGSGRKRKTGNPRKGAAASGGRVTGRAAEPVAGKPAIPEGVVEAPDELDSEAKIIWYLEQNVSASQSGILAGLSDGRGRQVARLRRAAPHEPSHAERDAGQEPTDGGAR